MDSLEDLDILIRNRCYQQACELALKETNRQAKVRNAVDGRWVKSTCDLLEKLEKQDQAFELLSEHMKRWHEGQNAVDDLWIDLSERWDQYKRDRAEVLVTKHKGRLVEIDKTTGELLEEATHNMRLMTVIDVETTGFEPQDGAEIIELAYAVIEINCKCCTLNKHTEVYKGLRQPNRKISKEVTRYNGITKRLVRRKKLNEAAIKSAIDRSAYLVAHNAKFDRMFLRSQGIEGNRGVGGRIWRCSCWDIEWKRKHGLLNHKLATVLDHIGHDSSGAHNALFDVDAVVRILARPEYLSEMLDLRHLKANGIENNLKCWPMDHMRESRRHEVHASLIDGTWRSFSEQSANKSSSFALDIKSTLLRIFELSQSTYKSFSSLSEQTQLVIAVFLGCIATVLLVLFLFAVLS